MYPLTVMSKSFSWNHVLQSVIRNGKGTYILKCPKNIALVSGPEIEKTRTRIS